jgi:hypothetical protein
MIKILIFTISLIAIYLIYIYVRKRILEDEFVIEEEFYNYGRILVFDISNCYNEEIELDLCQLDSKDSRYKFENSNGEYEKLSNYLKTHTLNVISTKVIYNNSDWQKDIIRNIMYNPFTNYKRPVFVAMNDFSLPYANKNIVESRHKYEFNYFNSLLVSLKPNESKQIHLFVVENDIKTSNYPVKTGVILKNNSNETQRVNLFDNDLIDGIEYDSLFKGNTYQELVNHYNRNHLVAKEVKLFSKTMNELVYKINFDDYKMTSDSNENHYYIIDLKNDRFIALFEIEIQANAELIITFN